ncbi:MAG: hypothetical protein EXQ74_05950 [Thermoleophilia bacterium]|nr:hypothetical protein [Thermoleophilia bacterium]
MAYALIAILSVGLVALVAWPLIVRSPAPTSAWSDDRRAVEDDLWQALDAIREVEMDHRAGNLSHEDFATLDRDGRAHAVGLIRRRDEMTERESA